MKILFCPKNQKDMLQKEIKDWTFEAYLLTEETVLDSRCFNHLKWLVPDPMHDSWIFWIVFLQCLTQTQQTLAVNFAFDIAKVSLVVALYFFTDCLKIIGKKVQISKALIFFFKTN